MDNIKVVRKEGTICCTGCAEYLPVNGIDLYAFVTCPHCKKTQQPYVDYAKREKWWELQTERRIKREARVLVKLNNTDGAGI